jgi:hypothetical protein
MVRLSTASHRGRVVTKASRRILVMLRGRCGGKPRDLYVGHGRQQTGLRHATHKPNRLASAVGYGHRLGALLVVGFSCAVSSESIFGQVFNVPWYVGIIAAGWCRQHLKLQTVLPWQRLRKA